jgi:hypothetical protein
MVATIKELIETRVRPAVARSLRARDNRFAQADDHEQAVALGEVSDRHPLQAAKALASEPGDLRSRSPPPASEHDTWPGEERAGDEKRHADRDRGGKPCDRRPRSMAAAACA